MNGRCCIASELPYWKRNHHYHFRKTKVGQPLSFFVVHHKTAVTVGETEAHCHRCGTHFLKEEGRLANGDYYCPKCVQYGRVTTHDNIYYQIWSGLSNYPSHPLRWDGTLSPYQSMIAKQLLHYIDGSSEVLIYAVTGSGKTQMIFPYIDELITTGHHIAYVAPRIDVVLEIAQRLQAVFPDIVIPILYTKQHHYTLSPLVACTIQQLIRFYHCFDVIIIDEVDAYPYPHNSFLEQLVCRALKKTGQRLYLSATLTDELEEKDIPRLTLPIRYHLQPLPCPTIYWCYGIKHWCYEKRAPYRLKKMMQHRQRAVLLFMPSINRLKKLYHQMKLWFPHLKIDYVYSQDTYREEKIQKMRHGDYDVLLTTTILERGVTFDNIDVWVLEAQHRAFTRQVLVQISGRVGRKKEYLEGQVFWLSEGWSHEMVEAEAMINKMNEERRRLLDEMPPM